MRLFLNILTILLFTIAANPVLAKVECAEYSEVKKFLETKYGETRLLLGLFQNGKMMEVYANAETGSWSIIAVAPTGISCIIVTGSNYKAINLVAKSTIETILSRHILDSAQMWQFRPQKLKTWVDLGSGGGFPALVLAILAKTEMPDAVFHMIESDARKCAFLRNVSRETSLNTRIHNCRIEKAENIIAATAKWAFGVFIYRRFAPDAFRVLIGTGPSLRLRQQPAYVSPQRFPWC